jgi:hypothetical protein
MVGWKLGVMLSTPWVFIAEAVGMAVFAQAGPDLREPLTFQYALIAGFAGALALQTWIIKYLLTEVRTGMVSNTEAVNNNTALVREMHMRHLRKTQEASE